jgi:hypothetical protein
MKNTTFAIYYILLSYYFQKLIYCPVSFPFDIYFGQLLEIFDISVISPNDVRHDCMVTTLPLHAILLNAR